MSLDFDLGLLLGIAGTLLYLLPWIHRLDKELDEAADRYWEMFEAAAATFDLPPELAQKARR